jgi:serine protease
MKKVSTFLALLVGVTLVFSSFVFADDYVSVNRTMNKPSHVDDEIVIKFKSNVDQARIAAIMGKYNISKKKASRRAGDFIVFNKKDKNKQMSAMLQELARESGVAYAEQNAYAYKSMIPNDSYFSYQWHMSRIGLESAWDDSTGSGVVVAVIDTGVRQDLSDLAGTSFTAGYDFVNNDTNPTDDEGHGSHVCGTIAQTTNNNAGCAGVAFNATIMPIKVLDSTGSGTYTDIADGIIWATDHGSDVINMSLGGSSSTTTLQNAVNYAWNNGVVVVCAAGNDGVSSPSYPAAYTNSISVSAVNYLDQLADYSNYGSTIDICAPGGDGNDNNGDGYMDGVLQQTFDSSTGTPGYFFYAGTSMASPHVAGVAALIKAADTTLTNAEIRNILENTAEDLGNSGWDQYFGYGIIDAYAAVQEALGGSTPDTTPPVISNIQVSGITSNSAVITWTTDEAATSVVYYGTTTSYGSSTSASGYTTNHSVTLTGLTTGTTYHFKVESADASGNTSQSSDSTFTTSSSASEMYIYNIAMSKESRNRRYRATAVITVRNTNGNAVSNATVYVRWTGAVTQNQSGTTNSSGQVTFTTNRVRRNGTFTVTVNNVTHATYTYNPALNIETSDSI